MNVIYERDESNGVSVPTNKMMVINADSYYVGMPLKKVDAATVEPTDGTPDYICMAQRNAGDEIRPLQIPVQEVFPDAVYTKRTEDGNEEQVRFGGGGKITPEQLPDGYPYVGTEEKVIEFDDDSDLFLEGFPIFNVGDTVELKVDGVEYSLVAFDDEGFSTVGDYYGDVETGSGKYGWQVYIGDDGAFFYGLDPHTVSWKVPKYHPIDHKFLPEGYPYAKERENPILEDFASHFAHEPLHDGSFQGYKVMFENISPNFFVIDAGKKYRVVFDGKTYDCESIEYNYGAFFGNGAIRGQLTANQPDGTMDIDTSDNGMPFWIIYASYYSTYTTIYAAEEGEHTVAIYEVEEEVVPMDSKFLPAGGGGAMIVTTDSIMFSTSNLSDFWTGANFNSLYYDDGSRASYSNSDKLINALNSGTPVYLFCDGRRRGEIWAAYATETSSGFVLVVRGVAYPEYYSGKCGIIDSWVN